jgi:FixJ family two-component response regulator
VAGEKCPGTSKPRASGERAGTDANHRDDPSVRDDQRVREALSSLIAAFGLNVLTFGSAAEFLQTEKPDAPACLVLDLQLPDATGLELQQQLLDQVAPPVVFISGHGDVPSSVRAMKAGALEFLQKPFRDDDLLKAIQSATIWIGPHVRNDRNSPNYENITSY